MPYRRFTKFQTKILQLRFITAVSVAAVFGTVGIYLIHSSHAQTVAATVTINVTGDSGPVQVMDPNGAFGSCASAKFQAFTIPATCTFTGGNDTPNGQAVELYNGEAPTGYASQGWGGSTSGSNGYLSCNQTACAFYFTSGTATADLQLLKETPPTLTLTGTTATTASLSWASSPDWNQYASYYIVYIDNQVAANNNNTSYTATGLTCGPHSFYIQASYSNGYAMVSNTISATSQACAGSGSNPGSSQSSSSNSSHTSSSTSSPSSSKPGNNSSSGNVKLSSPTAVIPPSAPTNFKAQAQKGSPTVNLSWTPSSPGSSIVLSYQIDRSVDQQIWEALPVGNVTSQFNDTTTAFGIHYYYRIRAVDSSLQTSAYTTTDVTTPAFNKNVSTNANTVISLASAGLQLTIPAGAVDGAVQCGLNLAYGLPLPDIQNMSTIGGPYQLVCKTSDGNLVTSFKKPLVLSSTINKSILQRVSSVAYYGYDTHNKLQPLIATAHNAQTGTYQVQLGSDTAFVIMGHLKHKPVWLTILLVILGILAAIGVVFFIISRISRWRTRKQAMNLEASYHEKEIGGF